MATETNTSTPAAPSREARERATRTVDQRIIDWIADQFKNENGIDLHRQQQITISASSGLSRRRSTGW